MNEKKYYVSTHEGSILFPNLKYRAYVEGTSGEDPHAYGKTPEEAIERLNELLEILS